MIRKFLTILTLLTVATSISFAQWEGGTAWPDTSYKGGSHGIAVDPDGNVWQSSYYKTNWMIPDGDTMKSIPTSPILKFSADGSTVDTIYTVTDGTVIDTLSGNNRGMGTDNEGNILVVQSGPTKIIKINYMTGARMASALLPEIGTSPTAPSTDENGTIFVGPVVGGGTNAIVMLDADLVYLGNAVVGPPNIARTMIVAPDGNTIYWTPFTGAPQKTWVYSRADEFSAYELMDSMFVGMSIESIAWQPGTGLLWVSNDSRGTDSTKSNLTWYGYNLETSTFVDSFSLAVTGLSDEFPRALDFSPDGKTAYVGLFGTAFDRVYKFTNSAVGPTLNAPVDFEVGGNGATWAWTTFANAPDAAPEIIPNPDMTGANTSATVASFTALLTGDAWAGFWSDGIGEFTFDETNSTVKLMVWKPVISNVGVKFEGATQIEKLIPNTVINAWEELTFDFSDQIGNTFNRLVFLPDFGPDARTQDNTLYLDNLTFSAVTTDINTSSDVLPSDYVLSQNYPNPFNPSTVISFAIPKAGLVTLKVYDMLGQEVVTLLNKEISTGAYNVSFDASSLSSGTYLYTLRVGDFQQTKKMIFMK